MQSGCAHFGHAGPVAYLRGCHATGRFPTFAIVPDRRLLIIFRRDGSDPAAARRPWRRLSADGWNSDAISTPGPPLFFLFLLFSFGTTSRSTCVAVGGNPGKCKWCIFRSDLCFACLCECVCVCVCADSIVVFICGPLSNYLFWLGKFLIFTSWSLRLQQVLAKTFLLDARFCCFHEQSFSDVINYSTNLYLKPPYFSRCLHFFGASQSVCCAFSLLLY